MVDDISGFFNETGKAMLVHKGQGSINQVYGVLIRSPASESYAVAFRKDDNLFCTELRLAQLRMIERREYGFHGKVVY
jgi:hypothetical protein